jgi:hypothetical protein
VPADTNIDGSEAAMSCVLPDCPAEEAVGSKMPVCAVGALRRGGRVDECDSEHACRGFRFRWGGDSLLVQDLRGELDLPASWFDSALASLSARLHRIRETDLCDPSEPAVPEVEHA